MTFPRDTALRCQELASLVLAAFPVQVDTSCVLRLLMGAACFSSDQVFRSLAATTAFFTRVVSAIYRCSVFTPVHRSIICWMVSSMDQGRIVRSIALAASSSLSWIAARNSVVAVWGDVGSPYS
jgi:hypothetical protein